MSKPHCARRGWAKSGYRGVHTNAGCPNKPWRAYISLDGKSVFLGGFKTAEEAHEAFKVAHVARWGKNSPYWQGEE